MAKSKKVIQKKPAAKSEPDDAPVTQIIDVRGGNAIRVFDLGPLFGVERQGSTVDLIAKDGVSYFFRRTGTNIGYNPTGFGSAPVDSAAYVTIEEVEAECYEISDSDRDRAKEALNEDKHRDAPDLHEGPRVGELAPPAPREEAPPQ